ncbi:MAG: metallophosphoesterase family protein [Armatimonadota bacterium]
MKPFLTLGLFTDAHYGPEPYADRDCPGSLARVREALMAYTKAGVPLVVNLGDAVDGALSGVDEAELCAEVREACDAFPGEVRHVIGNHDVQTLSKAEFLAAIGAPPEPYYSFDAGGVHCVVLDGNCHEDGTDFCRGDFSWDDAWISEAQLRWLADDLARAAGRPALVFCHECLDNFLWEGEPDPHVVCNAPAVREILRRAGVRAVLQGHYHHGRRLMVDGIPYITLPSLATGEHAAIVTVYEDGTPEITPLRVTGNHNARFGGRVGT